MQPARHHQHGRDTLLGSLLEPGDEVVVGDKYDSTAGTWQDFPAPGCIVQPGAGARIVRPLEIEDDSP